MGKELEKRLGEVEAIFDGGLTAETVREVLGLLELPAPGAVILEEARLYSEYLPKGVNLYSAEQRYLHLLWDLFDQSPLSVMVPFSIPFRRMIAKRLFRKCGKNFTAERHTSFNFGQFLEVGRDVFFNSGVFLDTKGGVTIGDFCGLAEDVRIFTHGHGESEHCVRSYAPVVIGNYVKVYSGVTICPGVTIGDQALVGANALVTKDVPPNTLVAGCPAVPIRERRTEGHTGGELKHIWLANAAFQDED